MAELAYAVVLEAIHCRFESYYGYKNITESIWYSKKLSVYLYKFIETLERSVRLRVRSHPFHGCNTGSNPVQSTKIEECRLGSCHHLKSCPLMGA